MIRLVLVLSCLAVLLAASTVQATPVAYWAFPEAPPGQNYEIVFPLAASEKLNAGTAQITTNAPVWNGISSPPPANAFEQGAFQYFGGSTLELQPGYPVAGGKALMMRGLMKDWPLLGCEGKYLDFQFDATACAGIQMIWAEKYNSTGPTNVALSYSTGGDFADLLALGFATDRYTSYRTRTVDLSSVAALDGCATAHVRLKFTGWATTSNSGAAYFDNVRFTPEPASLGFLLIGGLLAFRRR